MLDFYYIFIDKYIDRSDFDLLGMDTDDNYFAFSGDSIEKLINAEMKEEYENDKYNLLLSEELHPRLGRELADFVQLSWGLILGGSCDLPLFMTSLTTSVG